MENLPDTEKEIINKSTEQLIDEDSDDDQVVQIEYPEYLRFQQKAADLEHLFRPTG